MTKRPSNLAPRRSAFTLVEMTIAVALASLVFGAIGSAMLVASRSAGPVKQGATDALRALDVFNADAACALSVSGLGTTAVTFVVPDRTGDGTAETIRYSWAAARSPLLRTINGNVTTLLPDVRSFSLAYDSTTETLPKTYATSGEILLDSYKTAPLLGGGDVSITASSWVGQYFKPTMPSSATSWSVTRARVRTKANGGTAGIGRVEVRNVSSSNLPTTVIDYTRLYESAMTSSYAWYEVRFSNVKNRAVGSALALVMRWENDLSAFSVSTNPLALSLLSTNLVRTSSASSSWSASLTEAMLFEVYGTYQTEQPAQTRTRLTTIRTSMQPAAETSSTVKSAVSVLNRPEAVLP